MSDPEEILAERVRAAVAACFGSEHAGVDPLIRPSAFADFQANAALPLGKLLGRPPRDVATQIAAAIDVSGICDPPEVSGPGFLNFTLTSGWIAGQASGILGDPRLGLEPVASPRRAVVDYSCPNVAKEMHVGHLRTTIVGDAVVRILEHLGHTVIRANHLGDWGTPFGMLIEHILDVGEPATHAQLAAGELTAFYKAARAEFDSDPVFAERSRKRVVALQGGDPETLRLWQILVDDSKRYFNEIYCRLDVTLTDADIYGESFYNPMLAGVCAELEQSGVAVMSEGALCAFPPGFTGRDGAPAPMILRKSDGGYGYDTTDLAAIRYRTADLHADRIIYVTGADHVLHFRMLFAVARQAGWLSDDVVAEHAVIGLVSGAGGQRLRTRSGDNVKLITLIDEAVERAAKVIADRYPDPGQREQIAEAVGVGALKYGDLSVARDSGYVFDFDRMLALTGNTGPYLQYAAARIRSIFRKAGLDPDLVDTGIIVSEPAERELALTMLGWGHAVSHAAAGAEPHVLAAFLFSVASSFTTFYEACPVLAAPDETTRLSRLALSALTLRVLTSGLGLLGIGVPERM